MSSAEELLREGRYREGFAAYEDRETRWSRPNWRLPFPEWRGEPLEGKTLCVWGEQGIGDEIQMIRFLRDVWALKPKAVLLGCQKPNMRLFRPFATILYNRLIGQNIPDYDYWVGLLSLPHRFGVTREQVRGAPYLARPVTPRRGGIGLVWRGNPANPADAVRSLPSAQLLSGVPGGVLLEPRGDMLDSAAVLAGLDGLITVDTSWAHLGGALGIACSIILPVGHLHWPWGTGGSTPWYDSVRLHRQAVAGEWSAVIDSAVADQLERIAARDRP